MAGLVDRDLLAFGHCLYRVAELFGRLAHSTSQQVECVDSRNEKLKDG